MPGHAGGGSRRAFAASPPLPGDRTGGSGGTSPTRRSPLPAKCNRPARGPGAGPARGAAGHPRAAGGGTRPDPGEAGPGLRRPPHSPSHFPPSGSAVAPAPARC